MKIKWALLAILTALILAGCTPTEDSVPREPLSPPQGIPSTLTVTPSQVDTTGTESPTPLSNELKNLVEKAKADLGQHLSISTSEIELETAFKVIWPDSSLGCPQPGLEYAQVLTEGFLIYLEVDNQLYKYHTDSGEQIILCENSNFPLLPVTPGDIQDGIPWVPVN